MKNNSFVLFKLFLFSSLFFIFFSSFASSNASATFTTQGLSVYEKPKYPANFTHFEYVSPNAPKGGKVHLAVPGTFDSLNPFIIMGTPGIGFNYIFTTLLEKSEDEAYTLYPSLAESYELAPDKSSITFKIRKNATFEDGKPITADDVLYSFKTLIENGRPMFKAQFEDVKKAEKLDAHTVRFTFKTNKNTELPLILGNNLYILPKHFYEKQDFSKPSLTPPPSSGPYRVESAEAGRSIVYKRITNWWGENLPINKGRFNFDTIQYEYFRDPMVAFEAFKQGSIDFRQELIARLWATAYDFPAVKEGRIIKKVVVHQNPLGMLGFVLNTRHPFLKNIKVREALSYAFDFEWINKNLLYGAYQRTKSYFTNSPYGAQGKPTKAELKILEKYKDKLDPRVLSEEFSPPSTTPPNNIRKNLATAQKLLAEAGYIIKNGILLDSNTQKPVSLEVISVVPSYEKMVLAFIKNLKALGIDARYKFLDTAQYLKRLHEFDFDIIAGGTIPQTTNPGNEQRDYWGSQSASTQGSHNLSGISDPIVDELIEGIIGASTYEELLNHARALDRVLLWGFYVIPKWNTSEFRFAFWDKFGFPSQTPTYEIGFETWWIDPAKEKALSNFKKK